LAITFTILAIALIATQLINNDNLPNWLSQGVGITLVLFIIFGMFFTVIDFITLGYLKKKNGLQKFIFLYIGYLALLHCLFYIDHWCITF